MTSFSFFSRCLKQAATMFPSVKDACLSHRTHEEEITSMVSEFQLSETALPLLLYQFLPMAVKLVDVFRMSFTFHYLSEKTPCECVANANLGSMLNYKIGHCFLLEQRYSSCLNATFDSPTGKRPMEMGCYGLGLTRLLAASVEHLGAVQSPDSTQLRWPPGLSPFGGAVALQKETAKDALRSDELDTFLSHMESMTGTRNHQFPGDILVDNRNGLSLGRKLVDLKRLGIPWILIAKSQPQNQRYELVDVYGNASYEVSFTQACSALSNPTAFDTSALSRWMPRGPQIYPKERPAF